MPALVIFGRPLMVAGDDILVPSVLFLLLRVLQAILLIWLSVAMVRYDLVGNECPGDMPFRIRNAHSVFIAYLVVSYVLSALGLSVELGIAVTTGKGTPTQPEKRSKLKPLCYCKLIPLSLLRLTSVTLGWFSLSIIVEYCDCEIVLSSGCQKKDLYATLLRILVGTHFAEAICVGLFMLYFAFQCSPSMPQLVSAETKWRLCCRCFIHASSVVTCCFYGGTQLGDFADISMALEEYLDNGGTLDVVVSDIIVGLRMLAQEQEQRRLECRRQLLEHAKELDEEMGVEETKESETDSDEDDEDGIDPRLAWLAMETGSPRKNRLSLVFQMHQSDDNFRVEPVARALLLPKNPQDKLAIAEGARFIRLARAIYTYRMYLVDSPVVASCVLGSSFVRSCCAKRNYTVADKHGFHEESLLAEAQLDRSQLIYANFEEGTTPTPYCITIDFEWKSVVISIRGTQALEDLVTDMAIRPQPMEEWGSLSGLKGPDCYAHAGGLQSAQWIYDACEKHGLLDKFLLEERSPIFGYTLRVTGHSLGATVAVILSFMLKSKYPDLRCLAFSPAGCSVSKEMADGCKDFVTSYLLDSDIIPRLSLESMEHLRDGVLEMIARVKVPKRAAMRTKQKDEDVHDRLIHRKESIPPSDFGEQLAEFRAHTEKRKEERSFVPIPLFPPGRIVQLFKTGEEGCNCLPSNVPGESINDNPYTARWVEADDLGEVLISSHLLTDHRPLFLLNELERTAHVFGLNPPFTVS